MEAGSLACLGAVRLRSVMAGRGLNDGCCLGTTDDILAAPPAHRFPSPRSPICGRGVSQQASRRPPRLWAVSNMGVMSRPPGGKGKDHPGAGHTRQRPKRTGWAGLINPLHCLTWTRPGKEALPGHFNPTNPEEIHLPRKLSVM